MCLLAPLFLCFTIFGVREHREEQSEKAPPVSFRKIVSTITGNDQLLWIALIFLIQQVGNGLTVAGIGSTYICLGYGYRGGLYSGYHDGGHGGKLAFVIVLLYPMISRHMPRKRLMNIMRHAFPRLVTRLMLAAGLLLSGGDAKFCAADWAQLCATRTSGNTASTSS